MDLNDIRIEIGQLLQEIKTIEELDSDYELSNQSLRVVLTTRKNQKDNKFIAYIQLIMRNGKVCRMEEWTSIGNSDIEAAINLRDIISTDIETMKTLKVKMDAMEKELNKLYEQYQNIYNYVAYIRA